jgi:peptidoglycan/xylan/chitin deacetylase (PgdA/CDA1 family)
MCAVLHTIQIKVLLIKNGIIEFLLILLRMQVRNFLFHRISPIRDKFWDPMDVGLFKKCLGFIDRKYEVTLLEDLCTRLAENPKESAPSGKPWATLSFDDGFKDNVEYGLPILENQGLKASFYVVTDCIEQNIPTWTYQLDSCFRLTSARQIIFDFDFLPAKLRSCPLHSHARRRSFAKQLKSALKWVGPEDREKVMRHISMVMSDVTPPKIMMDWNDLRRLTASGHYVGSHSTSHSSMGVMTDDRMIRHELKASAAALKKELGYFPLTFSYPFGSYNPFTIDIAREEGYRFGLAVKQQPYDTTRDGNMEIPRIELYNQPWLITKFRL